MQTNVKVLNQHETYLYRVHAEQFVGWVQAGCITRAVSAMHDGVGLGIILSGWSNIVIIITGVRGASTDRLDSEDLLTESG
ncbi:hypothetical protein E2C01_004424 [Portunus trituberculatus]|uniref:Uncharacterized protein n=1 Tax=Portunus trituberculatus TaxID=210409 RepID=A0A5B7CQH7_PORTR|nr:hypothetical protein [Portunus trituberculatus]